jgi:rubrerythrin
MTEIKDFLSVSLELAAMEQLDVAAMELLFQLECSGEGFYNDVADRVGNDDAADLLRRNAREEMGHARRISRAIEIMQGAAFEPSPETLERLTIPLPDSIPIEMLPLIVQGEIDGDASYQRWADHESNPEVARLLRLNGREETIHGQRVTEAMAILEQSQGS